MKANPSPLITMLSTGIAHCSLYFTRHPRVLASAQSFVRELERLLDTDGRKTLFLGLVEGRLVHDGRFYLGPTAIAKRVVELIENLRCGGLLFHRDVTPDELARLFELAARLHGPSIDLDHGCQQLVSRDIQHVELSPTYEDEGWFGQDRYDVTELWRFGGREDAELESLVPVYQSLFETVEVAHGRAAADDALDLAAVRTASEQLVAVTQDRLDGILRLARYPDYDSYTIGHSVRVALFAVLCGRHLGLPQEGLIELGAAGLLHDVGKSKVLDEILYKPGLLTPEERHEMSLHAQLGAGILVENQQAGALAIGCAFGHHLRADGRGYPELRPWVKTGPMTAVMRVCDAFEGMTAARPHKAAVTPRRAFELLLQDRGGCEPAALHALVGALGFFPPGRRVLLSSGERALVRAAGVDPALPHVLVTHDVRGEALPIDQRIALDLGEPDAGVTIVELYREPAAVVPAAAPQPVRAHAPATTPDGCCG